jgi:hypothetical protein
MVYVAINPEDIMKKIAVALALLGFASCSTARDYGPDSPYYHFPTGWQITLNRPIEIPPGWATVRLQYGHVVPFNSVQEVDPHCIFELDTVKDAPQPVQPDSFTVTKVTRDITTLAGMTASTGLVRVSMSLVDDDNGGPTQLYYRTIFRLHSDRQPQVRSLTCQSDQLAPGIAIMHHLTVPEMHQALGDYFTLHLPN